MFTMKLKADLNFQNNLQSSVNIAYTY